MRDLPLIVVGLENGGRVWDERGMVRRIILENYMSHGKTVIELAAGLTVLVGPNNCGKSAVVEALRTVCGNLPSEALVRHGEKESRITVQTDDGHEVVWRRKGSTVSYVIDGREVHRLKRGVPEDLDGILKLPRVWISDERAIDVHIATQKQPIFEVLEGGSAAARFFSTSSDAEKLMQMQQRHREKVRNEKGRQKEYAEELKRLEGQLGALVEVEELGKRVEGAEEEHRGIVEESGRGEQLSEAIESMERGMWRCRRHAEDCGVLGELRGVPEMEDEGAAERLIGRILETENVAKREVARYGAMRGMAGPPLLEDAALLENVVKGIERAGKIVEYRKDQAAAVAELGRPPEMEDVAGLEQMVEKLDGAAKAREGMSARAKVVEKLVDPPEVAEVKEMEDMIGKWGKQRDVAASYAVDICEIDEKLMEVEGAIRGWAEANPMCPVCGAAVEVERVMGRVCEHGGNR